MCAFGRHTPEKCPRKKILCSVCEMCVSAGESIVHGCILKNAIVLGTWDHLCLSHVNDQTDTVSIFFATSIYWTIFSVA